MNKFIVIFSFANKFRTEITQWAETILLFKAGARIKNILLIDTRFVESIKCTSQLPNRNSQALNFIVFNFNWFDRYDQ